MNKRKRKSISKTTRFEVFKRDNFTCQYCGISGADVLLEIDHMVPVKEGGDNSILNLLTACKDCNGGKGARLLSDNTILNKNRKQMKELHDKREQILAMLEYQKELLAIDDEIIKSIKLIIGRGYDGRYLMPAGVGLILNIVKKCGLENTLRATEAAVGKNYSVEDLINKIRAIAINNKNIEADPPLREAQRIYYIVYKDIFLETSERLRLIKEIRTWLINDGMTLAITDLAKYWEGNPQMFWNAIKTVYEREVACRQD